MRLTAEQCPWVASCWSVFQHPRTSLSNATSSIRLSADISLQRLPPPPPPKQPLLRLTSRYLHRPAKLACLSSQLGLRRGKKGERAATQERQRWKENVVLCRMGKMEFIYGDELWACFERWNYKREIFYLYIQSCTYCSLLECNNIWIYNIYCGNSTKRKYVLEILLTLLKHFKVLFANINNLIN